MVVPIHFYLSFTFVPRDGITVMLMPAILYPTRDSKQTQATCCGGSWVFTFINLIIAFVHFCYHLFPFIYNSVAFLVQCSSAICFGNLSLKAVGSPSHPTWAEHTREYSSYPDYQVPSLPFPLGFGAVVFLNWNNIAAIMRGILRDESAQLIDNVITNGVMCNR